MNEKDSDGAEDTSFHLLGIPSGDESHELRSRVPFELLASQFVEELRAGKNPSVDLYARRFPPHAEKIREVEQEEFDAVLLGVGGEIAHDVFHSRDF